MTSTLPSSHYGLSTNLGRLECLVIMPMLEGYEGIRAAVARAVKASGVSMCRLEEVLPDPEWQLWLAEAVSRAELVLADLTDHNPFVMYELGLVHHKRLPTLLIVNQRNERVPATVLGSPFLPYDDRDLDPFEEELAKAVESALEDLSTSSDIDPTALYDATIAHWHEWTTELLAKFRSETSVVAKPVSLVEFTTRLRVAVCRGANPPRRESSVRLAWYLLPRLIQDADDVATMRSLGTWVGSHRML